MPTQKNQGESKTAKRGQEKPQGQAKGQESGARGGGEKQAPSRGKNR